MNFGCCSVMAAAIMFAEPSNAPVAQWIRASVFGTECRGFESLLAHKDFCQATGTV